MGNSPIKVCHMTNVHKRYDARILKKECCTLAANGYDVTLIVADNKADEDYNGVKITSIDFVPKNRWDRIRNSKKYMLKKAITVNADLYHFHDPELIPVGLNLLKRGKKVIYDSHEDYAEDIKEKAWIPKIFRPVVAYMFKLYEQKCAAQFNAIITVTPHIVKKFRQYNNNVYMVTNYPIVHEVQQDIHGHKNQVCFAGLITTLWCHENVVTAINLLNDDIKYVLAGRADPDYLDKLRALDTKERVDYLGYLDSNAIYEIQQSSFAGIAILKYGSIVCGNLGTLGNTKLFEYMLAGIPVICTDFILWKEIIDKWQCGICVPPNDSKALANAINYLYHDQAIAASMGKQGRNAVVREYNWETQAKILIEIYKTIFSKDEAIL